MKDGEWMKIRGHKSLRKSSAIYLYILLKILELLSLPLSCLLWPRNVAALQFCSLNCSILFLWATTIANHHGQQPLTVMAHMVLYYVPCSALWRGLPGCCREALQQPDADICYLNDASGLRYIGREIWAPRFLPHWLRWTFPRSLTISFAGPLPPLRCDSPLQLFVTAV